MNENKNNQKEINNKENVIDYNQRAKAFADKAREEKRFIIIKKILDRASRLGW